MTIVSFEMHCLRVIAELMTMAGVMGEHDQLQYPENSCFWW